jgi:hypothetical protein
MRHPAWSHRHPSVAAGRSVTQARARACRSERTLHAKLDKLLTTENPCAQALRASILLLDALVHEWLEILEEGGVPSGGSPGSPPPVPDLARLEGFAVCFLCSTDPDVRRSSWDLLSSVRRLHSTLTSEGEMPVLNSKEPCQILGWQQRVQLALGLAQSLSCMHQVNAEHLVNYSQGCV